MDESWRMRMGVSSRTPHWTTKTTASDFARRRPSLSDTLNPDDFADVFGGPPQTVLLHRFSGEFVVTPPSFYDEVFRPQDSASPAVNVGRSLPPFRIPEPTGSFFGDIFGSDGDRRSRDRSRPGSKAKSMSKSKSNSSSVLSSEDLSPMRPATTDDVAFSSFASKLRPINVPSRWNLSTVLPEEEPRKQNMSEFPCPRTSPVVDDRFVENGYRQQPFHSPFNDFSRQVTSPETVSIEPSSYRSVKIGVEVNSPSSAVSSLCQEGGRDNFMAEYEVDEEDDDDDEMSSSFVIEIGSNHREETREAVGVDEAIAWAKERFNAHRDCKNSSPTRDGQEQLAAENQERPSSCEYLPSQEEQKTWMKQGHEQSQKEMEMKQVDENIRSWSVGNENNIQLLLSTLHHVLWPESGWNVVPLTSLKESSQVKKAYQKARLCLHPDKLQQRAATLEQKYIAEKVFSILQDAWASFTTNDIFIR